MRPTASRSNPAGLQAERLLGRPAARELVPTTPGASARWHMHDYPGPYCRWNYHPEYEVHLIQHGTGRFIVGDHIGRFGPGHLVLVGSQLPHHWISDLAEGEHIQQRDVVFQFHPDWVMDCQKLMPELDAATPLLTRAARGIEFSGDTATRAAEELLRIGTSAGLERLQHILAMLQVMGDASSTQWRPVANPWLPRPLDDSAADVVEDALRYVFSHTTDGVSLVDAAARVSMSPSAFSRYFLRAVGQTFSDTVRKLRLAQACQLLERTDDPVSVIYHRTGYQNLSNFNRQFLREYRLTPTQYRRRHRLEQHAGQ